MSGIVHTLGDFDIVQRATGLVDQQLDQLACSIWGIGKAVQGFWEGGGGGIEGKEERGGDKFCQ